MIIVAIFSLFICICKNKLLAKIHTHVLEKMKSEFGHLGQDRPKVTDTSNSVTVKDSEQLRAAKTEMRDRKDLWTMVEKEMEEQDEVKHKAMMQRKMASERTLKNRQEVYDRELRMEERLRQGQTGLGEQTEQGCSAGG